MPLNENTKAPYLAEIEQALKEKADNTLPITEYLKISELVQEFNKKSKSEQIQKIPITSETSQMVKLVFKLSGGIIKKQEQAEYILFGFVILAIGVSIYLFLGLSNKGKVDKLPDVLLEKIKQDMLLNR